MRAIFLAFVVLGLTSTAAIRLLPWWGLAALLGCVALSGLVAIKWVLPRLLPSLLKAPFKAKGAVLRGATAQVHSIERAPAPPADVEREDDTAPSEAGECYELEVTISPRPTDGPFALWQPDELRLAGLREKADDPDEDERAGKILAVEVARDGGFEPASGMRFDGPQRLRLLIAAPSEQRRLRLRYYFELFGDIALPLPGAAAPTAGTPPSPAAAPSPSSAPSVRVTPLTVTGASAPGGARPSFADAPAAGERRSPFAKAR